MKITNDIKYIGVNDRDIDLFEGQYHVPNGMSYNSYAIIDEKIAIVDTVDSRFSHEWLDNIRSATGGKEPDYLIVSHMEPDHSANINTFVKTYPGAKIVANAKAFTMMRNFFGEDYSEKAIAVGDGSTLCLGAHTLSFITAPMVHWPEVIMTYDSKDKVLFSADAFGKFGTINTDEEWACEARRYYIGIVGKYGAQVQAILKKAAQFDIEKICALHGPILTENLGYYLDLYNTWSSYGVESEGIVIAYTSVYGNTKKAVMQLAERLKNKGCPQVVVNDLARCDMAEAVEDAFRYGKLVLATTTYNGEIFPFMREFIQNLTERNFQNRQIAIIENGSWAPMCEKHIKEMFSKSKNITFTDTTVKIMSSVSAENRDQIEAMADELCSEYDSASGDKNDPAALFKIGYGLYVITTNDGERDNGLIVNTVTQLTSTPQKISITVNKQNYSHHVIMKTGKMNINCLTETTPFSVFENFGFRSGRTADKFDGIKELRSENGLRYLPENINSYMSLKVEQHVDLGTHTMFICSVTESKVVSDSETMTYTYYHQNVKPKPKSTAVRGYVCQICGYVHEGETLPEDFVCPICKHGAADFEPIN